MIIKRLMRWSLIGLLVSVLCISTYYYAEYRTLTNSELCMSKPVLYRGGSY